MNWRTPFVATLLVFTMASCTISPQNNAVSSDAPLLSDQTPNPRGIGDPNAPVKISEYTDYQ